MNRVLITALAGAVMLLFFASSTHASAKEGRTYYSDNPTYGYVDSDGPELTEPNHMSGVHILLLGPEIDPIPQIEWVRLGDLLSVYHYSQGFLTGVSILQGFKVDSGCGEVEIVARVNGSTFSNIFSVEEGKSYQLAIRLYLMKDPLSLPYPVPQRYTITLTSPSADSPLERTGSVPTGYLSIFALSSFGLW